MVKVNCPVTAGVLAVGSLSGCRALAGVEGLMEWEGYCRDSLVVRLEAERLGVEEETLEAGNMEEEH